MNDMNTGLGRLLLSRFVGFRLLPGQVVALAAIGLILLGACLLMLPFATTPEANLGFLDAMFTATSAVCVTGLIVMDTPHDFTLFGQIIILLLIQIGGLGYALMATLILLMLGRRLGLRDRMMLTETMNTMDMQGLVRFVKLVTLLTFGLEGLHAAPTVCLGLSPTFASVALPRCCGSMHLPTTRSSGACAFSPLPARSAAPALTRRPRPACRAC